MARDRETVTAWSSRFVRPRDIRPGKTRPVADAGLPSGRVAYQPAHSRTSM